MITFEFQRLLFDGIEQKSNLELRLWAAADDLRANSGLKSSEYSSRVLGLIF